MTIQSILQQLGYSEKEVTIYLCVLELQNASAPEISRHSNVPRTYVYDICKKLIEKGLLKETKIDKKIAYIAQDPQQLLKEQKNILEKLESIVPELSALHNISEKKPKMF